MTIGGRVYGLGAIVLGIPLLISGDFAVAGLPALGHSQPILAYASAGLLILAGLAVNAPRLAAPAGLALAAFFALWVVALHAPHALAKPTVWVMWEDLAENVVKALGGVLVFALATKGLQDGRRITIVRVARPLFGLCVTVFGISEFVYAKFTAAMVPTWLPPSQLAWAYVTGAAQIAAGLAILSGVRARLAALLLTAMYLAFSVLVHLPRVIANPSGQMAWAENGTNLVLAGAAWALADALQRLRK